MIKAIIFDFFGVISTRPLESFAEDHLSNDPIKLQKSRELRELGDRGVITREDLLQALADLAGAPVKVVNSYQEHAQLNVSLIDYIRHHLKLNYKIGILSNAAGDYTEEIMGRENLPLFDDIVLSYKEGLVKPQPEIYRIAAKNLGVTPAQCLFIDDSPTSYDGAKVVGMKAVWYQNFAQMKRELEKILADDSTAND